jgi:hypothetical protein
LKDICWSIRVPGWRYDHKYRLVVGSDIDFSYPNSKELAQTVANLLLPINEFAIASSKDGASMSALFGAMGMDPGGAKSTAPPKDPAREVDPKYPPSFVYVCPDVREKYHLPSPIFGKGV